MEIIWRRAALNDLEAIREFIAQDNPRAATRIFAAIKAAIDPLADHPNLGRPGRVEGTRELIVAYLPYIVVYRVAEGVVRVLAVIHTSRQWPRRFCPAVNAASSAGAGVPAATHRRQLGLRPGQMPDDGRRRRADRRDRQRLLLPRAVERNLRHRRHRRL